MIRIVGVQRNENPEQEFVLLQNQGSLRANLRGHVVLSECAIESGDLCQNAHIFSEESLVPPGMYVLLHTGRGTPRWARTKDGAMVYYVYMGKERSVWGRSRGPLHVLSMQHTFSERREAALLMR